MRFWVITDTHFGHKNIIKYCGRPEDHESLIFRNTFLAVKEEDVLIHLGDVCMGKDEYWHELCIKPLPCKKWLVRGNHDNKSNSWYLEHGWDFVADNLTFRFGGKTILFSHKPTEDKGQYELNIHGHFHNSGHHDLEPELVAIKNEKHILIAIENTEYAPVLLEELVGNHPTP